MKKALSILVFTGAVIVAIVVGIKFLPDRNSTITAKNSTITAAPETTPGPDSETKRIYEKFLASDELKKTYPEINALVKKKKKLCTEEQLALLEHLDTKSLDASVLTKTFLDLDGDGVNEMTLSLDLNGSEKFVDFYVFDLDSENNVIEVYKDSFSDGTSWYGLTVMQDDNGQYYFISFTRLFGHTKECEKLVYNGTEMVVELSLAGTGCGLDGIGVPDFRKCTAPGKTLKDGGGKYPIAEEITTLSYDEFNSEWISLFDETRVTGCCDGNRADLLETVEGLVDGNLTADISYKIYENGCLLIEGTGEMPDNEIEYDEEDFWHNCDILYVSIAEGITGIGDYSFNYCIKLSKIDIPASVTRIGENAFNYCSSLTEITLPVGLERIEKFAFWGCDKLTDVSIPEGTKSIGAFAFAGNEKIKSVTIPDSVTEMGLSPFSQCISLESIIVNKGNSKFSSDSYGVLFNKDKTELLQYPLGNDRKSYTIPDTVKTIGCWAFCKASNLIGITIPDGVTEISDYAFGGCFNLSDIIIPDSITVIGKEAFRDCYCIKSIKIPEGVTHITTGAFGNCSALEAVTIPTSVTRIDNDAFFGSSELAIVYYGGSRQQWDRLLYEQCSYGPLEHAVIIPNSQFFVAR